jgi:hypothetical protein
MNDSPGVDTGAVATATMTDRMTSGEGVRVAAEDQQRHRQQSEKMALAKIADRIATQFPELPAEQIEQAIHGRYEAFDQAPVRDFVPVLVERQVRRDLASRQQYGDPRTCNRDR